MKRPLSNCCYEKIVLTEGEEGTNFYICAKCHKACDPSAGNKLNATFTPQEPEQGEGEVKEYEEPCKKGCLVHKYHCSKCNTAVSYSPANFASRPEDIPNHCEYCFKSPKETESEGWAEFRNEWMSYLALEYYHGDLNVAKRHDANTFADWWLDKFSLLLSKEKEKVRRYVEKGKRDLERREKTAVNTDAYVGFNHGWNAALSDLLSLLEEK